MFETTKLSELEKNRAKTEGERAVLDALLDMMLEAAPDDKKAELTVVKMQGEVCTNSRKLAEAFTVEAPDDPSPAFIEAQKGVAEYLTDVANGIKEYYEMVLETLKNAEQ